MAGNQIIAAPLGPRSQFYLFADFMTTTNMGLFSGQQSGAGAAANNTPNALSGNPGLVGIVTGTSGVGSAGIVCGNPNTQILFGGGVWSCEWLVNLSALSDGTDTYSPYIGFVDANNAEAVDGAYFGYVRSIDATNWPMCTSSNSSRTRTASSTPVVAGAWVKLRVVVNAAGTSVEFFVNDVSIGTVSATIPTGAGRGTAFGLWMTQLAGTASRTMTVDYCEIIGTLTTPR